VQAAADNDPGKVVQSSSDFAFGGGRIDFEMRQKGTRVTQLARNRYMVPIVMAWEISGLVNLEPTATPRGIAILPPASSPNGTGQAVELASFDVVDAHARYYRDLNFHARFGDPTARPTSYVYGLPYHKQTFAVLQGFHGAFSHRGSNEFAVDFDCPVATPVVAARPGVVVVTNDAAQGSGTTPEFLDYKRTNFVLVLHDDGTLGEYMHLSPSGVEVAPGQHVDRGQRLALSGNTGYSSTPHLHFQVMTASDDGVANRSFPFELAAAPNHVEEPVQGRSYPAWE
jgi:murein DD-endopeptidase MepM/ murein hydrolase activator NlpD